MEAYLIVACLSNACEPAYTAYLDYNPQVKLNMAKLEARAASVLATKYWLPIVGAAAGREVPIHLFNGVQLIYASKGQRLAFSHTF